MDDKRLKEIEHYAGLMDYPADTEAMTDLIAEIRRLRGRSVDDKRLREIEDAIAWGLASTSEPGTIRIDAAEMAEIIAEIRRLRGMVDGLLNKHPWSYDDCGTVCGYCGNERRGEFSCPAHQCAWASAMQQRDWKPEEAKREDTGA